MNRLEDEMEALIDKHDVYDVAEAFAAVCHDKAKSLASERISQNSEEEKRWAREEAKRWSGRALAAHLFLKQLHDVDADIINESEPQE